MRSLKGVLCFIVTLFCLVSNTVSATEQSESTQVILLLKGDATSLPANPQELIDAVNSLAPNGQQMAIRAAVGSPTYARYGIRNHRLSTEALAGISHDTPVHRLHRFVVLNYSSAQAANAARDQLLEHTDVMSAQSNEPMQYSAWNPSDTYFPYSIFYNPWDYQWGIHALNLPAAWDYSRGWGYVSIADNGIDPAHADLQQNFRPHISYNVFTSTGQVDELFNSPAVAGHGTHVAGIVAATADNSAGTAGVCPNCSLFIAKISDFSLGTPMTLDSIGDGIYVSAAVGAQVVNLSLGAISAGDCTGTPAAPFTIICQSMAFADSRDMLMVAAAGNHRCNGLIQFPARDGRTIAVGGIQSNGSIWTEVAPNFPCSFAENGSNESAEMATHGVVAPAKSVISTWYAGENWNVGAGCPGNYSAAAYDTCTGTSMATPHITGLTAMMRSTNPLLTVSSIKSYLFGASSLSGSPTNAMGHGLPNASTAVQAALGSANQLTPLFSFYSSGAGNYFYTAVPQMGAAAATGQLFPNSGVGNTYASVGTTLSMFSAFAGDWNSVTPRSEVWVFTTHNNPFSATPLIPLYRLSYACNTAVAYNAVCVGNAGHVDHAYTTDPSEISTYVAVEYKLDGIEGYVYPDSLSPQTGMVRLVRRYNSTADDHAIFPESELTAMGILGYTVTVNSISTLGWVYPNSGSRPTY